MKKRQLFTILLVLMMGLFLTTSALANVQSTYTVTGTTLTVLIKADQNYNDLTFSSFHCTLRYLTASGITLTVNNSYYSTVIQLPTIADPTNANYTLASFDFAGQTPASSIFLSGVEYAVFDCTITGGDPEEEYFSLVEDSPNYQYAYFYMEFDQANDVTNFTDPFYPGDQSLTIKSEVISGSTWKYAGGPNYWLSTAATTNWHTASNWSFGVPLADENITINFGANQPVVSGDGVCNDLVFADNSSVEIQTEGTLTVAGDVTIGTGNLFKIKSDAASTGSLIQNTAGVSGEVERFINGWGGGSNLDSPYGWHEISSPVAEQPIGPFQNLSADDDFFKWNEPTNTWINRRMPDGSSLNPDFETEFVVGQGYLVAYPTDANKEFIGVLNVEDVTVEGLTNTDTLNPTDYYGQNFLGNPYSSALEWGTPDWDLFPNVGPNCQIWHEANASYSVLVPGDHIPAMNGFMVYYNDRTTPGSVTIPKSARIHSDQPFYKSGDNNRILLVANDLDQGTKQESIIRFDENAASGTFDLAYDAYFLGGFAPMFYSFENNGYYALNTYAEYDETMSIPFGFVKNDGFNFSIKLQETIEDVTCYLTDLKTNFTVNLSEVGEYSFTAEQGDDANRFLLKFGTVSIDENISSNQLNIYSANSTVYLNPAENFGKSTVSIFDMLGREVLQREIMLDSQNSIEVPGLSGNYIVRVLTDNAAVSVKVYIP